MFGNVLGYIRIGVDNRQNVSIGYSVRHCITIRSGLNVSFSEL